MGRLVRLSLNLWMMTMMSRIKVVSLCCGLLITLFALCLASNVQEIKPSKGIGAYSLDAKINDLKVIAAPSFKKDLPNGDVILKYDKLGLLVQYRNADGAIQFIGISKHQDDDREYSTQDGIHVGMSRERVEKVMGLPSAIVPVTSKDVYPDSKELAIYKDQGISFHYNSIGDVVWIMVFKPSLFKK